jgi:hypothetical protein
MPHRAFEAADEVSEMKLFESDLDASPGSVAIDGQLSRADRLFAALDAIWMDDPAGGWITEVLGIHASRSEWWVQIAAQANSRHTVLLHLSSSVTIDDTIKTLRWWSLQPVTNRSHLVTVLSRL